MTYPIDKVAAISAKPIFQVNIINNMWKGIGIHHPELRPTYCGAGRLRGWVGWDGNLERLLKAADQSSHNIDEDVRSRRGYLVGAYSGTTSQDSQDSTGKREFLATGWNYRWVTFIPHGSDQRRIHCFGLLGTNDEPGCPNELPTNVFLSKKKKVRTKSRRAFRKVTQLTTPGTSSCTPCLKGGSRSQTTRLHMAGCTSSTRSRTTRDRG